MSRVVIGLQRLVYGPRMRRSSALFSLSLLLVACRPSQSELDAINAKLDTLAGQQEEILETLGSQRSNAAEGQGAEHPALISARLTSIERTLDNLGEDIERLEDSVLKPRAPKGATVRPGRPDPRERYRVEIGKSHVRGRADALVTLVMWTDYQCPFCKRVQPTIEELRKQYGKNLRIVMKHNPLPMHNRAMAASLAAEAAGKQGKFWQMHAKLYQDPRALTDETIEGYARALDLDMKRFKRALQNPELEKQILAEQTQGSTLGARGTPAFFINGRFLSGAQPREAFESLIDEELAHAKALVKKGTKKRDVYKTLIEGARTKP